MAKKKTKTRKTKPAENSKEQQKDVPGKPFQPGQSGNPGGRPKVVAHVRELAREHTDLAIRTLAEICESADKDSARVAAATALLDRGYGKPPQEVSIDVSKLSDDELFARARSILTGGDKT